MSSHDHQALIDVGTRLLETLTGEQVTLLLGTLLATMPSEWHEKALVPLAEDTRLMIQRAVTPPVVEVEQVVAPAKTASMAKLEEIWASLWKDWDRVVRVGSDDEGKYLVWEDDWAPSYFDEAGFVKDLEAIAVQILPLVESAIIYQFSPKADFIEALSNTERQVGNGVPDSIELGAGDGFLLEESLTTCLLKAEWLFAQQKGIGLLAVEKGINAFHFALKIRESEEEFEYTNFDADAFLAFFGQLPDPEQRTIFDGLDAHRHEERWKNLKYASSTWHLFYIDCMSRYAPERYIDALRETIPQKWQNGLPIIKELLAKESYEASLEIVQETLHSMLRRQSGMNEWTPQKSLYFGHLSWHNSYNPHGFRNERQFFVYYEETARALGQTDLADVLAFQLLAFDRFFDWEAMLKAFRTKPLPDSVRQTLLRFWSERLTQNAKPGSYWWNHNSYGRNKPVESWWVAWLLESVIDVRKGKSWFQQKISDWLTRPPMNQQAAQSRQGFLRLLTEDLNASRESIKKQYPKFHKVVISSRSTASLDSASRRAYLRTYGPPDLLEQVIACWKRSLRLMVPNPKDARKSDYTLHANWMSALRELDVAEYSLLLGEWRDTHRRRRNLWRDMSNAGLG